MSDNMTDSPMPEKLYFERHIFFCLNERKNGEASCAQHHARKAFDQCKQKIREADLSGQGQVRVNQAGCLGRCDQGPVAVVYPEGTWYTFVDEADINDIVESHLKAGKPVDRLRLQD